MIPSLSNSLRKITAHSKLVAAVRVEPPFTEECLLNDTWLPECSLPGINFELFRVAMAYLGYDFDLVPATNNITGFQTSDGNWTGMMQQLVEEDVNVSVSLIAIRAERMVGVDFTPPIASYEHAFLLRRPDSFAAAGFIASSSFLLNSWPHFLTYYFLGFIGLFSAVLLVKDFLSGKVKSNGLVNTLFSDIFEVENAIVKTFDGNLFNAVFYCTWATFLFLINAYFTASLCSGILMKTRHVVPFQGLYDFMNHVLNKKYTLITDTTPAEFDNWLEDERQRAPNRFATMDAAFAVNPPEYCSDMDVLQQSLLKNSSLVFYASYYRARSLAAEHCDLMVIKDTESVNVWAAFAVKKRSKLVEDLSLVLYPDGDSSNSLMRALYNKYAKEARCKAPTVLWAPSRELSLVHLQLVFAATFAAYAAACAVFLAEMGYAIYFKRDKYNVILLWHKYVEEAQSFKF